MMTSRSKVCQYTLHLQNEGAPVERRRAQQSAQPVKQVGEGGGGGGGGGVGELGQAEQLGRLERRVSAQKLARRRTGALDAAEAAGIRRELDELRDLVLGTVRRGVDVADRIYRRLEDGAARRGAASEGLAALALATERVERDIHGLARRLKLSLIHI